ncbi:MAG: response regulator transcription factor [Acidimicrobiales bacterium]
MKLLVVEDDLKIAAALRRGLEAEGFTVEVSHDGDDGLWRALESAYDLVVLDLLLPGRNGFQVCRELRAAKAATPILVLTAKDGELDETEALDTGADDYLVKPFSFPVLVSRIRALLRRAGAAGHPPCVAGRLRLDPAGRRAFVDGSPVALTAREFDLLEHLVRRQGQVLSKAELLAGVWPDRFDGDPNVVEVFIRRLRRKLDEPYGLALITTVRGSGYRLEAG